MVAAACPPLPNIPIHHVLLSRVSVRHALGGRTLTSSSSPYYGSDTSPNYFYGSGSEPPVTGQLRYPQSWPAIATTGDQSGYSQPNQSTDTVGNLLEFHEAEVCLCHNFDNAAVHPRPLSDLQDMNYSSNNPRPNHPPPSTSFQDAGTGTDATHTNVGSLLPLVLHPLMISRLGRHSFSSSDQLSLLSFS